MMTLVWVSNIRLIVIQIKLDPDIQMPNNMAVKHQQTIQISFVKSYKCTKSEPIYKSLKVLLNNNLCSPENLSKTINSVNLWT